MTASTALATGAVRWSIDAPPGTDVKVTFTPSVPLVHAAAPDPRTVVLERAQLAGGTVTLNATDDPDVTPTGWTWVAHLRVGGQLVVSFPFDLPTGAALDLAELAPVPESAGVTIVRGPAGPAGPPGPPGPGGPPGSGGGPAPGQPANIDGEPKLQPLRAALATADTARVNVLVLGDSQTEGEGVTSVDKRFVSRLSAALRARLGLPAGGRGYFAPVGSGEATYPYPATLAGGGINADQGAKAQGISFSSPAGGTTYALHGTAVDLMDFAYGGGGSYTAVVDGGAPATISTDAPTDAGHLTRLSLGASGAHTLAVRGAGDGAVYHLGLIEYDGDQSAGVTVHDCGHFGWTAAQWTTNLAPGHVGRALNALSPDAVIIALGHNDINQGITAASFRASLTTLIGQLRAGIDDPNPPILLLGYPADAEATAPWQPYLDAMAAVAAADPQVAFLDLSTTVPDHSVPGLYADPVHGNNKWHGMVAQVLADYLAPTPVPEFGSGSISGGPSTGPAVAVSGRLYHSAPVITGAGPGPTMVPFDHADYLMGGITRSGAGLVAPLTGLYDVNAVGWFLGGNVGSRILIVYVNGVAQRQFSGYIADGGGAELRLPGADKLRLTAGDVVTLGAYKTGAEGPWRLHSNGDPMDIGLALTLVGV